MYRSFANEMTQIMNEQLESGIMNQGNVSKDKRTMIRLSGKIHVLYKAMDICLTSQTPTSVSRDQQLESVPAGPSASGTPSLGLPYGAHSPSPDIEASLLYEAGQSPYPLGEVSPLLPSSQCPGASISEKEAQMAVALTEYFQEQCRVYQQKASSQQDSTQPQTVASLILITKGAFCSPPSVVRSMTTQIRPTASQVMDEMRSSKRRVSENSQL